MNLLKEWAAKILGVALSTLKALLPVLKSAAMRFYASEKRAFIKEVALAEEAIKGDKAGGKRYEAVWRVMKARFPGVPERFLDFAIHAALIELSDGARDAE